MDHKKAKAFPDATYQDWRATAAASLKGKDLDSLLLPKRLDGLSLPAFVPASDDFSAPYPPAFTRDGAWQIGVCHAAAMPCNPAILDDLRGGANALCLDVSGVTAPGQIVAALDGVFLEMIELSFLGIDQDASNHSLVLAALDKVDRPQSLSFGLDPFLSGRTNAPDIDAFMAHKPEGLFTLHGQTLHHQGADLVTEGAALLSGMMATLRLMESQGLTVQEAASKIRLSLAVGEDIFAHIAKVRSLRRLAEGILLECGLKSPKLTLEARQSLRRHTALEPATNAIRLSVAGVSAGLGGADCIYLNSFSNPSSGGTPEGRRLARNAQIIMLEESHLARVSDPANGSYLIEAWTERLSAAIWDRFTRYEGAEEGFPYDQIKLDIEKDRVALHDALERDEYAILSANRFPDSAFSLSDAVLEPKSLAVRFETARQDASQTRSKQNPS